MSYSRTTWFQHLCHVVLFMFTCVAFHPANFGLAKTLDLKFSLDDAGRWTLDSRLFSITFGPTPAYGQSADLAPTPDANSTDPFIVQKAAELGNNAAQIFAFVRDEIGYESYKGSLRGARGTLWSKAGNALDQASLLIALLRASNIPARYVSGTLSNALAQELILSMFPAPLRITGFVPDDAERADPANDPKLLAETREHYWVQFNTGGGFQDADPTFASATIGQTFTTSQGTFTEVSDQLRYKVTLRLNRELTTPAAGLLTGGLSQDVITVLDVTFNTVELVGKPLSISHFVNRQALGTPVFASITNTYSPYIAVGDFAAPISEDEVIRGTDYQEVLTNFPLGSTILTGLFLKIDVSGPDGPTETFERTLVDLIGFDVRTNGGSPNVTFDPNGPPTLTDIDIFTVNILTGLLLPNLGRPLADALTALQSKLQALRNDDGTFPLEASDELRELVIGVTRLNSANYFTLSDFNTTRVANTLLIRAYSDQPRIVISSITVEEINNDTAALAMRLDLRSNDVRAVAYPGQNITAVPTFNMTRGFGENAIETNVVESQLAEDGDPRTVISTATVFAAATAQGIAPLIIGSENLNQIGALDASAEAKVRMTQAVENGLVVIVPSRSVIVGQTLTTAWYEVDPVMGNTVGVTEDGGHQALSEHVAFSAAITFLVSALQGFATAFGPLAFNDDCSSSAQAREKCKNNIRATIGIGAAISGEIAIGSFLATGGSLIGFGGPLFFVVSNLTKAVVVALVLSALDPPAPDFLISPAPLDELSNLSGTGVVVEVVPDPLFTLPVGGALLPTVFRVGIKNSGASTDIFSLNITNVPTGFEAVTSVDQIEIPPGETAEVGLALRPIGVIPAPGADASFSVTATSTSNPSVTATVNEAFSVPEVHSLTLIGDPLLVSTIPGTPVTVQLSLESVGNVPNNITFDVTLAAGLTLNGLNPITVNPGETAVQTLTLTPAAGTPLNTTLAATITANFGAPEPQSLTIPIRVAAPGVESIASAAVAVGQLGSTDLAQRLNDLSIALTNLVQNPSSDTFKSQALASLDSILSQLANDTNLSFFVGDLTAARNALAAANTPSAIQTAVNSLGGVLDSFAAVAGGLAQHNFEAFLLPNSQAAQPQTPAVFDLRLHNIGTDTTTYNVSLGALPAGVTGQLSQASATLNRDEFASISITLTQTATTELLAFNFEVTVSAEEAPSVSRTVQGALTVRNAFISVVEVIADPPFTDPGGQVNVSARLLNVVNQQQAALVSYIVQDPNGQTVFTSQPVQTTLTVQTSLVTLALGTLDTTGFGLGQHTIAVTITDLTSTPIPGATGEGNLLIGSPVTASISIDPTTLPPGDGMVTNTLQITSQDSSGGQLDVVGQVPIGDFSNAVLNDLALNGTFAYVFANNGLHVVDISNPNAPAWLRNVGGGEHSSGEVAGNRIIAIEEGPSGSLAQNSARGLIDFFTLSGGGTPAQPFRLQANTFLYQAAGDLIVVGNNAFVATNLVCFNTTTNDIFSQHGDVLSFSIDPSRQLSSNIFQLEDVLLNTSGTTQGAGKTAGCWENGGNFNLVDIVQVSADTLLAASSTATGTNTQTGVGRIRVVDISNPASLAVIDTAELQIPGTVQVHGIAINGNVAFVTATQGGWRDPFTDVNDIGPTGNIVLATVDVTDPRNPQLLHSEVLNRAARGMGEPLFVGNGRFAFASLGALTDSPQIIVVDASDPTDLGIVTQLDVAAPIRGMRTDGDFLYTSGPDGLTIYQLGGAGDIPVTAQVQVPKNTGVAVDLSSFSIPPTNIINDTNFDTLVWEFTGSQTVTWKSNINNLQPGEAREVTLDTTIDFTFQGVPGQITLPPTVVTSQHILTIDPPTQTVRPGETAPYSLTVKNPTSIQVTYDLSIQGVPSAWMDLASSVTVPAESEATVALTLTSDPFAALAEYGFVVTATANGTTGSVVASLILEGDPVVPEAETQAHGVVVSLTPTQATAGQGTDAFFTVRVTNTGSETDLFDLSVTLPAGFVGGLEQDPIEVPPGSSNFRDVSLTLTSTPGTTLGNRPFSVMAVSTQKAAVNDTASGTVTVVGNGVTVDLSPNSGNPSSNFQMLVRNTGQVTDTFDLALGGPVGVVSSLGTNVVTLNPGASQVVPITMGAINFAYPDSLELVGIATSRGNTAVKDSDTATVVITTTQSMEAEFDPDTVMLPAPAATTFLLLVHNTGNVEDAYTAEIMGTSGPITTAFNGLDGQPTQQIDLFRLPGLSTGALLLNTTLTTAGRGEVTVKVTSLTNGTITDTSLAVVQTQGAPENHPPVVEAGPDQTTTVGQPISLAPATFTDADTADTHTATVDWGDGTQAGATVNETNGSGTLTASHSYTQEDTFTVTVCVTDNHEAAACDTLTVTVSAAGAEDPFLCYKTRSSNGDLCTTDAPKNPGGVCDEEEDCGGTTEDTSFCVSPRLPKDLEVVLADQFEPRARVFAVKKAAKLCNPADVDEAGIVDFDTHLQGYHIELLKGQCAATASQHAGGGCTQEPDCGGTRNKTKFCVSQPKSVKHSGIRVTNQFHPNGDLVIEAVKPNLLLVPTAKSLTGPVGQPGPNQVDHYQCYQINRKAGKFPTDVRVTAVDQFNELQAYRPKKLTRLCMPVDKNGEGIKNPEASLLCYQIKPLEGLCVEGAPVHGGEKCHKEADCGGTEEETNFCAGDDQTQIVPNIFLNNQFGPDQVDAIKDKELCVPSELRTDGN